MESIFLCTISWLIFPVYFLRVSFKQTKWRMLCRTRACCPVQQCYCKGFAVSPLFLPPGAGVPLFRAQARGGWELTLCCSAPQESNPSHHQWHHKLPLELERRLSMVEKPLLCACISQGEGVGGGRLTKHGRGVYQLRDLTEDSSLAPRYTCSRYVDSCPFYLGM